MKKILIIRFSSIGDIVLTSPVIRCIKHQIPGVELHYLTKYSYLPLLSNNPYIDKLHFFKNDLKEVMPELKKEGFDHIVDLHKSLRSRLTRIKLRRPTSSFSKLNFKKWMLVKFKINRLPDIHVVDRYFEAVQSLGVSNDGLGLDYFIPEQDLFGPDDLPPQFHDGYIAFVIGGKHATKCLPQDKIRAFCRGIDIPVVLLGGDEDRLKGEEVSAEFGELVYNACGKYNINQSAAIIQRAGKVITNDTGLMHIAAALGKEILSVWGNTVPAFGMYPYFPENEKNRSEIFEVNGLSCRPCSKIGYDHCPKKHFKCMNDIDEKSIIKASKAE